jgi:integrase
VRDYKRHLKAVERWKPASVNLALAALDSFYTQLGLGRPVVRREDLPAKAPRARTEEQVRRLLRMAERASARDRAIVVMLLATGLRLAELVALDLENVRVSARKGLVVVRSRKPTRTGQPRTPGLGLLGRGLAAVRLRSGARPAPVRVIQGG